MARYYRQPFSPQKWGRQDPLARQGPLLPQPGPTQGSREKALLPRVDRHPGRRLIQDRQAPQVAQRQIPELLHRLRAPRRLHLAQPLPRPGLLRQRPERRTRLVARRLPGQIQRRRLLELSLRGRTPTQPHQVAQPLPTQHRRAQRLRQTTASRHKRSKWRKSRPPMVLGWWPFFFKALFVVRKDALAAILESQTCISVLRKLPMANLPRPCALDSLDHVVPNRHPSRREVPLPSTPACPRDNAPRGYNPWPPIHGRRIRWRVNGYSRSR
jgi:hypothetical protein